MEVKDILRIKRIENEMTMKELADKVGVSEGTISRWESGDIANMKRDKIVALADALGISPLLIMGIEESEPRPDFRKAMKEFDAMRALPDEDQRLLHAFHTADPTTQAIIMRILGIER